MKILKTILVESAVTMIRVYQAALSPLLGGGCRFYPSCSEYFCGSLRKWGPVKGLKKGLIRIFKCHPFNPGGYDPF
jgi:uncharacterized protein